MKQIFLSVTLFFLASIGFAQDQVLGKWLTDDGEAVVEIYKSGEKFNGKIIWLKSPNGQDGKPLKDEHNPEKGKQAQPLLGLIMLQELNYVKGKWEGGTIYDPEEGKKYKCTMWLEDGKLKVRGYWGVFYQTQTWSSQK